LLAHLDPQARHIARPSHRGEPLFVPQGLADIRQYRCLLRMIDGATVVGRLRLRESRLTARPRNLSLVQRLKLAAAPRAHHERDTYLWSRDHRVSAPYCPTCASAPSPAAAER
jgi:hypothetical protein